MLPVPPLVDVTAPVVLFFVPEVAPVTVTLNMHVPLAAIEAPLSVIVLGLVVVSDPPQVAVGPEVATVNPAGSVSVNPTPVKATVEFGLVIVKVKVVVPPIGMLAAPNILAIIGGATTVMLADAVSPVPPFVAETLPETLFFTPAVAPVTVAVIMQLLLGAIDPPLKLIVFGAVLVTVPPHCVEVPLVTVNPAGKVSMNATPVSVVVVFELVIVNVSTLVPPSGIVAASNALVIDGGPITVSVALLLVVPGALSFEVRAPDVLFHTPTVEPVTVTMT